MSLRGFLESLVKRAAEPRARVQVPPGNDLTGEAAGVRPVAEEHYLRLWISELYLENDRRWFTTRFPLAYSMVALKYGDQKSEIANVSGRNRFDITQADLGRSVLRNYPLTPLLPFRGGTVELDCGLVSMQADNVLKSFAGVVSDLASKLNVAQVSSVVSIADSIATGVQELLGAGNAQTVLYVHEGYAADQLASGHLLLSARKQEQLRPGELWMTTDGLRQGADRNSLRPLEPQDYMVIRVQVVAERDDWRELRAIKEPFDEALNARLVGEAEKAGLLIRQAIGAALRSSDLTKLDKTRVAKGMKTEFDAISPMQAMRPLGATAAPRTPREDTLTRAAAHVSIDEARRLMQAGEDELIRLSLPAG